MNDQLDVHSTQWVIQVTTTNRLAAAGLYVKAHPASVSAGFSYTTELEEATRFPTAEAAAERLAGRTSRFGKTVGGRFALIPVTVTETIKVTTTTTTTVELA